MEERLNQRLVDHEKFGPVWAWEEKRGDSLITMVQSMMIKLCPRCHYPYCQTIPVQVWAAETVGAVGRFCCPECHWIDGLEKEVEHEARQG